MKGMGVKMVNCCEGIPTEAKPKKRTRNTNVINFASLSPAEQTAFADFQLKEKLRHQDDIDLIERDLAIMKKHYGIEPRGIFLNRWLEVQ
jgi:hypothetical protein